MTLTPVERRVLEMEELFETAYAEGDEAFIKAYQAIAIYALHPEPTLRTDLYSKNPKRFQEDTLEWTSTECTYVSRALNSVFTKIAEAETYGVPYEKNQLAKAMTDTVDAMQRQSEKRNRA